MSEVPAGLLDVDEEDIERSFRELDGAGLPRQPATGGGPAAGPHAGPASPQSSRDDFMTPRSDLVAGASPPASAVRASAVRALQLPQSAASRCNASTGSSSAASSPGNRDIGDWSFGRATVASPSAARTPLDTGPDTWQTTSAQSNSHAPEIRARGYCPPVAPIVEGGESLAGSSSTTLQPSPLSFASEPHDDVFAVGGSPVSAPCLKHESGTTRLEGRVCGSPPLSRAEASLGCLSAPAHASQGRMPGERGWMCVGSERETSLQRVLPQNGPVVLRKIVRCQGLYGIGMAIDLDEGGPLVVRQVRDLRNGANQVINSAVKEGDVLLAVNGLSLEQSHGRALSENLLWGAQHSTVRLTLQSSATQDKYLVVCMRHVPIRSWDITEVCFGLSPELQAAHSGREFVIGEKVVELLNEIRRSVVDESGKALDWLQPLQDWQYHLQEAVMTSNGRGFKCRVCDIWYAREDSLAYHLRLDCPALKPGVSGTVGGAGGRGRRGGRGAPCASKSGAEDKPTDTAQPRGEEAAGTSVGIAFAHEIAQFGTAAAADRADHWWSQMKAVVTPLISLSVPSNPPPSVHKEPRFLPGKAVIEDLMPGGPADRADLRRGDVVVEIDGQHATADNVNRLLKGNDRVGSVVVMSVERNGSVVQVELVRAAASHLKRAHDVLECIDRLSHALAQDRDSVSNTSPEKKALYTPNVRASPTESTVLSDASGSVAGGARNVGRVSGFETSTTMLGVMRTLVIEHLRLQQIEHSYLAHMLARTQTEIIDVLNALAADLRLAPPKVFDLSSECQGLRQRLLKVETTLLECQQARAEEDTRTKSLIAAKETELQQCCSKLAAAQQELAEKDQTIQALREGIIREVATKDTFAKKLADAGRAAEAQAKAALEGEESRHRIGVELAAAQQEIVSAQHRHKQQLDEFKQKGDTLQAEKDEMIHDLREGITRERTLRSWQMRKEQRRVVIGVMRAWRGKRVAQHLVSCRISAITMAICTRTLDRWLYVTAEERGQRRRVITAIRRLQYRALACAFASWQATASRSARCRRLLRAAMTRMMQRRHTILMSPAFDRWRKYGMVRARLRRTAERAAARVRQAARILAFAMWSQTAKGRRMHRGIVARCLRQRMWRSAMLGFDAWRAGLELEGAQREAIEREEQHSSAIQALEADLAQQKQAIETAAQAQVDKAHAETKVLQKYLEQVQQEHKFVCDNKNFVSHQLGLPPPADAAVIEKLKEQVRKTTAENRALKEKLNDKLEALRKARSLQTSQRCDSLKVQNALPEPAASPGAGGRRERERGGGGGHGAHASGDGGGGGGRFIQSCVTPTQTGGSRSIHSARRERSSSSSGDESSSSSAGDIGRNSRPSSQRERIAKGEKRTEETASSYSSQHQAISGIQRPIHSAAGYRDVPGFGAGEGLSEKQRSILSKLELSVKGRHLH